MRRLMILLFIIVGLIGGGYTLMRKPKPVKIATPKVEWKVEVAETQQPIEVKRNIVEEYLQNFNLPIDITTLHAMAYVETRLNPNAIGDSGELGILQIMPSSWDTAYRWIEKWQPDMLPHITDWRNVKSNAIISITFLHILNDEIIRNGYNPSKELLLTAYNRGVGGAISWFSRGRCLPTYTQDILRKEQELRQNKTPNKLLEMIGN